MYGRRHCTELFLKGEPKIEEGRKAVTSLVRMDRLLGEFLWWFWFWWFSNANAVYVNDGHDDNCNETDNEVIFSLGLDIMTRVKVIPNGSRKILDSIYWVWTFLIFLIIMFIICRIIDIDNNGSRWTGPKNKFDI